MPTASPRQTPGGALRFQTPGGRSVLPKNASEDTLVLDGDGNVISDLGSLLAAGMIEPDGLSYRMVGQQASDEAPADGPDGGDTSVDQDSGQKDAGPEVAPFADQQTEQLVNTLQTEHGQLYEAIIQLATDGSGIVPSHQIESAARELGVSTEQAKGIFQHVAQAFQHQVARHIADQGIDFQNLQQWLKHENTDPKVKELFNKAMQRHARDRTLEGYDLVTARFLETLARDHPEALMRQLEGVANIRKDPSTGAVLVDIPNMGKRCFQTTGLA